MPRPGPVAVPVAIGAILLGVGLTAGVAVRLEPVVAEQVGVTGGGEISVIALEQLPHLEHHESGWDLPERRLAGLPEPDPSSPLYAAQLASLNDVEVLPLVGCPSPAKTPDEASWRAAVTAQWQCLTDSWAPTLKQLGVSSVAPALEFFDGEGADSECGWVEAPAFYCSAGGGTGYFGAGHREMAEHWELSVNEMVGHEYGHHLQSLFGITAAKVAATTKANGEELDRRAELQATCLSGAFTVHDDAVTFDHGAYVGWRDRLDSMLADDIHGTRASLTRWGMRGLYATNYGQCNTWLVDEQEVR